MEKDFNNDNSKKLIIGVSILFCTVILIIGGSIAFFTQSDSGDTNNVVTIDKVELEYNDDFNENTKFMRQELIPASYDNVIKAYTREDTENKCLDSTNIYSACSVYKFSIKNISDISQELQMTLNPTANSYTNLKFLLYEITENENKQRMNTTELIKDSKTAIPLYNLFMLKPNKERTFEIIFYIEAKDYDQTQEDAGKQFGAGIRVDSITTGTYVVKNFGESCWTISGNTLTAFNGIDNNFTIKDAEGNDIKNPNYGKINESCTGYINDDDKDGYYSVYIPSNIGGQEVTTLDSMLFFAMDTTTLAFNNYSKINNIEIEEGITTIKDGVAVSSSTTVGTFTGVGVDSLDLNTFAILEDHDVNIVLPSTLESIGSCAFMLTGNKTISFNEKDNKSKLKNIGTYAFTMGSIENITIPSSMESIGDYVFYQSNISNLEIPSNITYIGNEAFGDSIIDNLTISGNVSGYANYDDGRNGSFYRATINNLEFKDGITEIGDYLFFNTYIVSDIDNPLIIPKSVTKIGEYAIGCNQSGFTFKNDYLTRVIFEGAEDNTSSLTYIGDYAFSNNALTYTSIDDPLIIPASVTQIGIVAFYYSFGINPTLHYIKYMGNREAFDNLNTTYRWYNTEIYAKPLEEYGNE